MFEQGVIFQIAWLNKPLQNEKIRPLGLPRKETEILQEQNFPWAHFSFSLISRTVQPCCAWHTTVLSIQENKKLSLRKFRTYSICFLFGNPRGIYIPPKDSIYSSGILIIAQHPQYFDKFSLYQQPRSDHHVQSCLKKDFKILEIPNFSLPPLWIKIRKISKIGLFLQKMIPFYPMFEFFRF